MFRKRAAETEGRLDDVALLEQITRRREEGLLALHDRYVNLVFSLCLQILGERMAAEEVTQDVFMQVWERPDSYQAAKGRFSSWLLTVARHACIDRLRRESRRPTLSLALAQDDRDPQDDPALATDETDSEQARDLWAVLLDLPPDQRDVIRLAYYGGMSQQDIADQLHLPLGTVKTRMRLGMEKLRSSWIRP